MKSDFASIVMNPVRQRIAQYLIINHKGTVNEIANELSDVPRPSIYRHIKVLLDNNCIEVIEEKQIRGAVEKTYALVSNPLGEVPDNHEISMIVQSTLMKIMADFSKYFQKEDIDPQKDMISVSSSTLMLSDEEFMEMFSRIGQVYNDYICNKPDGKRKPRNITIISSPDVSGKGE